MYAYTATEHFQQVYAQHKPTVYHFLHRLTRNHHEASDLVQDTFLRYYQSGRNVKESSVRAWLFQTSYRVFVDHYRKKTTRAWLPFESVSEPESPEHHYPETTYLFNEWETELCKHMDRLKPKEQQILTLLAWEGLSYREIAERMDCTESTVKTSIHRARNKMRHYCGHLAASI
ncbi:hypothetical protein SY83_15210 [Paenibacillus swuensis]|uniref:HTH luxR-type domain-containing protein n=1 Tax=Paenibacillus swuensis TaxID=1178515 RepID=A0A172TK11_9BACL|nr:RNA polymerase sigma factor [Paenibacillus swuensis]ANE47399.1 hypothetical protein SY83_15210 [Paenibacillus swuensis]